MLERTSFRNKALVGYMAITLPLSAVMAIGVTRLNASAAAQVQLLRSEENEITLAHRLRASAELLVSAGRAYLITGDPALLRDVQQSEAHFDESLAALENGTLSPTALALVKQAEQSAIAFRTVQSDILDKRRRLNGYGALNWRFEAELLPLGNAFGQSLDRLVEYKERSLDRAYEEAQRDRDELAAWTYGGLFGVTLMGVALAFRFVALLAESYRKERDALDAAQQALAVRDELMGIVAHDLRNPLNAIALKAALLRQSVTTEKAREHAASIGHVTKTMADLITRLLDVSTLEAGCFEVAPAACAARTLVADAAETFANLAASKGVRLEQSGDGSHLLVLADRERVLQVLSNLLGNALKVTPPGGSIGMRVEHEIDAARFTVWDTGPGIQPDHIPHIFDRRWKHEVSGTKGTGLGLFIARGIIEAHGGRIWAESEPDQGANFHFTLPLADQGEHAHIPAREPPNTAPAEARH